MAWNARAASRRPVRPCSGCSAARLLGCIESAETIIDGNAPKAVVAAAIRDHRQALDHATLHARPRLAEQRCI
ncbi:hypothetical protein [Methylobacterium sp. sgz302541]|uniref:hypothetical protein n=1 Tax=unclassified Methylobacterium TaxID=2615210 RepID=UPI003D32D9E1